MERVTCNKYIIKDLDEQSLLEKGFRYNKQNSSHDSKIFSIRFPVIKHRKFITIECEILVRLEDGHVIASVYDESGHVYAPYYNSRYGNFLPVIAIINKKILKEFTRLGIEKVE